MLLICELKRDIYYVYVNSDADMQLSEVKKKMLFLRMLQNTAAYLEYLQIFPWLQYGDIVRDTIIRFDNEHNI